ncbi:hypothetical protein CAPTEDRAFT_215394 [Capitella teleta]|uniref:BTB domain-containing protein n=1 Tax=Capitella teleta TaxID=283909 RepID=R7UTT2_CAPTE|nr:hypothetical protein CAPTEDRAFT_215394 [Capitella teleta]|eukprot:ELU07347.1 hypothetical protein CAPTEDRAFT_215394 [Capitella teleta]
MNFTKRQKARQEVFNTGTSYLEAFMTSLRKYKESKSMTDVTLVLADHSTIDCHKLVLAIASPFFETMFRSGFKESTQKEVHLDFTNSEIIRKLVDYFYSGRFIQCLAFYRCARQYSLGKLVSHCFEHMLSHFENEFCSSESFVDLTEEELIEVLSDDRLRAENEDVVFHSVVRWVEADLEQRNTAFTRIARFVRFPFCTSRLLSNIIASETLMMNSTCLELFREAHQVKSAKYSLHLKQSVRSIPRQGDKTNKSLLFKVCGQNFQYTEELNGENTKWHQFSNNFPIALNQVLAPNGLHWMFTNTNHVLYDVDTEHEIRFKDPQRSDYSLTYIQNKLYAFGGTINKQPSTRVDSLDNSSAEWKQQKRSMLHAVCKPYTVPFGTKLYVLGGIAADGPSTANQEFDPIWGKWKLKQSMPGACESGAALSLNSSIFVVGGAERACFRYTPTTDTWIVLLQPTHVHTLSTAITAWKGNILLCGGDHGEEYNPDTGDWSPCDTLVGLHVPKRHGLRRSKAVLLLSFKSGVSHIHN